MAQKDILDDEQIPKVKKKKDGVEIQQQLPGLTKRKKRKKKNVNKSGLLAQLPLFFSPGAMCTFYS